MIKYIRDKTNKEILEKLNSQQTKVVTGFNEPLATLGPRLQKINPETLQLIKVYESISECMKENNNIKRPSINKAIEECTIYNGFRWLLVDRELDPSVVLNIKPTKITKCQNLGYIAKLNAEKTEIIDSQNKTELLSFRVDEEALRIQMIATNQQV